MNASLPRIEYFALGGTIASKHESNSSVGAIPTLSAEEILESVPQIARRAKVVPHQHRLVPSPEITLSTLAALIIDMRHAVDAGAAGIILTQGTDTIEETAFVLDLLWDRAEPVVVTGAMRNPSLPGAEGPANLLNAVLVASSAQARELGVLVTMNDEIHAARYVHKSHTSKLSAFTSPGLGPIGWISENVPFIAFAPRHRATLSFAPTEADPAVALIKLGMADDCRLLEAVETLGYEGVVIEGLGGGHVPAAAIASIDRLVQKMPVLLASRTGAGETLGQTYQFIGSEIDLLQRGALRAGSLGGSKARMLLMMLIAQGSDLTEIERHLELVGGTAAPVSSHSPAHS